MRVPCMSTHLPHRFANAAPMPHNLAFVGFSEFSIPRRAASNGGRL